MVVGKLCSKCIFIFRKGDNSSIQCVEDANPDSVDIQTGRRLVDSGLVIRLVLTLLITSLNHFINIFSIILDRYYKFHGRFGTVSFC